MEALQNRLEKLEHATGSDIWQILKESEEDLRQDMASLNTMREEKERKNRETIRILQEKRKELAEFKNSVKSLKTEYQNHIKAVEEGLKASGLNMKQVVRVYEQVLADSLSEKRSELVSILILDEPFMEQMQEILGKALKILENGRQKELRNLVAGEVAEFHGKVVEIWRKEMWNLFQKYNLPMNALEDTSKLPAFIEKLIEICQFSADLDLLLTGSHSESIPTLLSTGFGHLINLCVDMIENEKGEADFEWILTSAHKWSKNLKEMMERGVRGTSIEDLWKRTFDEVFNAKFVTFIHSITKVFVMKNLNDPLLFTKLSKLFRRFEATCEFDISDHDLFEPLYSPEVMSKWVLLEVELFTFTATKILSDPNCFQPLSAISIGSTATSSRSWASEVTVFFEEWLIRVDSDVSVLGDVEVQKAFLESVHALMLDVSNRIHHAANQLYAESTWSNDVYLVMNTMWELRRMVENLTVTWPISSFEIEKVYENEWRRLAGMISEYLNDIVDSLDKTVRSNYVGSAEKIQLIQETFYHILKCLRNVSQKASQLSRSPLLNILTYELFRNFQKKFDRWKGCSVDVLAAFYTQIYSNLVPHLEKLASSSHWLRQPSSRAEMCRLDALMKAAANRDPSGELVRTAFKSIDEEQVVKMLAELGIRTTSDHAFQDYQILAENWEKIKDKGYGEEFEGLEVRK